MIINNINITLESLTYFSSAYKKGLIELNINAIAKELNFSRISTYKKLNGIRNKTIRNKKSYLDDLNH